MASLLKVKQQPSQTELSSFVILTMFSNLKFLTQQTTHIIERSQQNKWCIEPDRRLDTEMSYR